MIDERAIEAAAWAHWNANDDEFRRQNPWCKVREHWHEGEPEDQARALIAMRAALTAALPLLIGEGWRPIESAPKDGTEAFLWSGFHTTIGAFSSEGDGYGHGAGWYERDDYFMRRQPTHWMPLPAAPDFRAATEEAAPLSPDQREA